MGVRAVRRGQAAPPPPPPPTSAGYPLFGRGSRAQRFAYLGALALGLGLVGLYRLYLGSGDVSPDSVWGYAFAIGGVALLALVGVGYALRKRRLRHAGMRLHTALAWHITGGLLGIALIFMHTAGNFNPRSGTYALYGLIAVGVSGVIGRWCDRVFPRLAAAAAAQALTADGEDRLVALQQKLADAQTYRAARQQAARPTRAPGAVWDLAYYDLDPEIEAIPRLLNQGRPVARSGPTWGALGPATMRLMRDPRQLTDRVLRQASAVDGAVSRERFFLAMIRVWRRLHALLCVVTLGLLIWHIVYAVTLLMNAR